MQFRASLSRHHEFLLLPRVDEWIPAGHMARIISEAVAEATGGQQFDQLTADAGYFSADNVAATEEHHIDAYIAAGSDQWRQVAGQTLFGKGQFTYDAARNS